MSADFKYDNSFLEFLPKNTQISHLLVPNLGIFIFSQDFTIRRIWGYWFQIWQYYFQIPAPKYPNQAFLVPNLRILFLHLTLLQGKFRNADLKYDNVFSNSSQKYPNTKFYLKTQQFLLFKWNLRLVLFSQTYLLISKRSCCSRIDKNYFFSNRNWEIIFYSR